jgi:hypothetical protein
VKTALINAVRALHPYYVFSIPEAESKNCYTFLAQFLVNKGQIFSTNYDLLLYWVLMRNMQPEIEAVDGFGRNSLKSELHWGKHKAEQNIHYLHGALPLFDTGYEIIKEEYDDSQYILEKINARMEKNQYPIFVTAGDGDDKLWQIMSNRYLAHCYEALSSIGGSLVTYGFNFGEYDEHIIDAINRANSQIAEKRLWSIYIGVFSESDKYHIESIQNKFKCKVHIFDAKTTRIWR